MRRLNLALEAVVFLMLVAGYLLQAVTPLRLQFDSIILLSSAETASRGGGFLFHGQSTVFPPGYPALVALLMRLHLAYVWLLVCINILFLLMGLLAIYCFVYPTFFEKRSYALTVCTFLLLSGVIIQLFPIPLTDFCFFGVAMCCLAVMNSAASRLTIGKMITSVVLVAMSICVRRTGIALVPSLFWIVFAQPEARPLIRRMSTKMKAASALLITGVATAVAWVVYSTSTLRDAFTQVRLHGVGELVRLPIWRLTELGEITVNVPSAAVPYAAHVFVFVGIAVALLVLCGLLSRRKRFGVVDVFFVSYVAGILAWPFYATRFWLPVLPLLIGYSWISLKRFVPRRVYRPMLVSYATLLAITGVALLALSTRVSVSGSRIGDVYLTGVYDRAYCAAGLCSQKLGSTQVADKDRARRDGMDSWLEEDGLRLLCEVRDGRLAKGNK